MSSKSTHPKEYTSIGSEYETFSLSEHNNSGASHCGVPILVVINGASKDINFLLFNTDDDVEDIDVVVPLRDNDVSLSSSSVDEADGIDAKLNAADALFKSGVFMDDEEEGELKRFRNVDMDVFFFFFFFVIFPRRRFEVLNEPNVRVRR